jgi:hypothetical protein
MGQAMRHGTYVIPPHGLRRVWRVEIWEHGTYVCRRNYRRKLDAITAASVYKTQVERAEQ